MATIQIQIPDDKLPGVIQAFAAQYGYRDTLPDPNAPGQFIPNPVAKPQFAKNCIVTFIKQVYVANSVKAVEAQRTAAIQAATEEMSGVTS